MDVYTVDPLADRRWAELVGRHPRASVFHTPGWLRALQRTYGFEPVAFTTSPPSAELRDALVFAAVNSRLTGRRLVSLPFSDHCEPLVDSSAEFQALCAGILRQRAQQGWKYVELRPIGPEELPEPTFRPAQTFLLHRLDLGADTEILLRRTHRDSIQRKVRRAEREGLHHEEGRSDVLLRQLCHLLELTRRRHGVPMQPAAWFRNLLDCIGIGLSIRIASRDGIPVAGMLTLAHGRTVVYKYGGSDSRFHPLGGMPFLFWSAIRDARESGAEAFDLGRSDRDNPGLIAFKEHLGATASPLTYWRSPGEAASPGGRWTTGLAQAAFRRLPAGVRAAVGNWLYPHVG